MVNDLHTSYALLALGLLALAARSGDERVAAPDFQAEVLPILTSRCFECHGPDRARPKGNFRIDSREALLRGGYGGATLLPDEPENSPLLAALAYEDEDLQMPPDGKLPDEELELLEAWVLAGAPWPATAVNPGASSASGAPAFDRESLTFFEQRVRPLLAGRCFECHGPEVARPKGGLRMTGRGAFLLGGDSGPALDLDAPESSLLLRAVHYEDADRKMPPDGMLPDEDIRDLERWVELGAPWPPTDASAAHAPHADERVIDLEAGRSRWAFRPVERPPVPEVAREDLVANEIDAFVLARLEAAGLEPNPRADRRTLLRRMKFVLLGLPATLEELDAFEDDADPTAWSRRVERALEQRAYGERWARHWLDVVRYAQTNGYERDSEKPLAWRYRDWVIDALCEDLPYDRFLLEQLAGDELPDADADSRIATGFYRLGAWDKEPNDPVQAQYDELDDVLRTITEGTLGVTLGCARCHDHKFDPFPQEDYYSMLAFLRSVAPYDDPLFNLDSPTLTLLDDSPEDIARWHRDWKKRGEELRDERHAIRSEGRKSYVAAILDDLDPELRAALDTDPAQRTDADRQRLAAAEELRPSEAEIYPYLSPARKVQVGRVFEEQKQLASSFRGDMDWALTVREVGPEPLPTHLLRRGRASTPGREVEPRYLRVLCASDEGAVPEPLELPEDARSTGRRLQLARWIADDENPLTARVIVNRVWHHHFGRGLVPTLNDFGSTGLPPTHPELLDWLAAEFMANGWSLKWLHRKILESSTWRTSSVTDNPAAAVDPDNRLLWRQSLRRMDAEALRDAVLAVSGNLRATASGAAGRGFYPRLTREVLGGMSKPGLGWGRSSEDERAQRSVYAFVKRGVAAPLFEAFDAPTAALPVGARPVTTTATQALTLLNGEFADRMASDLARTIVDETGIALVPALQRAFERVLARAPTRGELNLLADYTAGAARDFARTDTALVFRPRVPRRVAADFLGTLSGRDLLFGPRRSWRYLRGAWGLPYNNTLEAERERGPAALWTGHPLERGSVRTRFRFEQGTRLVAFLMGADGEEFVSTGLELAVLPEEDAVELWRHDGKHTERLARAALELAPETWHTLRMERTDDHFRATLDEQPLLDAAVEPPGTGWFGVRAAGEAVQLDRLTLRREAEPAHSTRVVGDHSGPPTVRALAAACLLLLNTNEFAYVD